MKFKTLLLGLCAALVCTSALAALQPGTSAPPFTALASKNGKSFHYSLKSALRHGPVVVYFYPSAYTRGCDIEAHTFSTDIAKFKAAGASVVGVSLDSISRLNDFSKDPNYCAGNFPVASDPQGRIARSYDLKVMAGRAGAEDVRGVEIGHGFAERTTFVINPNGTIAATIGGVAPADNVEKTLAAVQALSAGK
ncbi:MAG TPA: peroxiredoxin [Steroidobacteraceae bacterium]|nr:peroxiredoxin [Steroidobacteraceae bacterium]